MSAQQYENQRRRQNQVSMTYVRPEHKRTKGGRGLKPAPIRTLRPTTEYRKQVPSRGQQMKTRRDVLVLANREQFQTVATVNGEAQYQENINPINPKINSLAHIAAGFSYYRFKKLRFEYIPECTTGKDGRLTMAFGYDPNDTTFPPNIQQLSAFYGACTSPFWVDCTVSVDIAKVNQMQSMRYISPNTVEKRWTDVGILFIDAGGGSVTTTMGTVWIDYEIELFIPQPQVLNQYPTNTTVDYFELPSDQTLSNGVPLALTTFTGMLNAGNVTSVGTVFTLQPGTYIISSQAQFFLSGWGSAGQVINEFKLSVTHDFGSTDICYAVDDESYGVAGDVLLALDDTTPLQVVLTNGQTTIQWFVTSTFSTYFTGATILSNAFKKGVTSICFNKVG